MVRRGYLLLLFILRAYFEAIMLVVLEYNRFLIIEVFRYSSQVLNRVSSVLLYFLYPYGYSSISKNTIRRRKSTRKNGGGIISKDQSLSGFGLMLYSSVPNGLRSSKVKERRKKEAHGSISRKRKRDSISGWVYNRIFQLQILIFIPVFYFSFLRRTLFRLFFRSRTPNSPRESSHTSDVEEDWISDDEVNVREKDSKEEEEEYNTEFFDSAATSLSVVGGRSETPEVGLLEDLQLALIFFSTGLIESFRTNILSMFDILSNITFLSLVSYPLQIVLGFFLTVKREKKMRTLEEVIEEEEAKRGGKEGLFEMMSNLYVNLRYVVMKVYYYVWISDQGEKEEKWRGVGPSEACWSVVDYLNYPHELYTVQTDDGYILDLVRIPRKGSRNVVYFQHGVLDSCFAWISSRNSLPFHLHDIGCDVFLGNFRGTFSCKHARADISKEEYWDFSINEHGFYDVSAFVRKIHQIKHEEECEEVVLTAIGHSLGAEAILMNILWSRMHGKSHNISQTILLAPAGYHETNTWYWDLIGPFVEIFIAPFSYTITFPSEIVRFLVERLFQDVRNAPATRLLFQGMMSSFLGSRGETLESQPALMYSVLGGTSTKIYFQFQQQVNSRQFSGYDYGSQDENIHIYGTTTPVDFFSYYHLIDIPIHFLAGTEDSLIYPSNVLEHYEILSKVHPDLSFFKLIPHCGHTDFTLSPPSEATDYILTILKQLLPRITPRSSPVVNPTQGPIIEEQNPDTSMSTRHSAHSVI